jgi:hypothetical protein
LDPCDCSERAASEILLDLRFFRTAYCLADCSKALCCCFFPFPFHFSFVSQLFSCISLDTAVTRTFIQPCWIHLLEVRMCEVAQNPLGIMRERKRPGFQWALHQLFEFVVPVAAVICLSVHYVLRASLNMCNSMSVFLSTSHSQKSQITCERPSREERKKKRTPQAPRRKKRAPATSHHINTVIISLISSPFYWIYTPIHMTLTTMSIPLPSPPSYL